MIKIQELRKRSDKIRNQIMLIEEKESKKLKEKSVDKYYKYRASYSCPLSENDFWWLYIRIDKINDAVFNGLAFQKDKWGKIFIDSKYSVYLSENYKEITQKEFEHEYRELLIELENYF